MEIAKRIKMLRGDLSQGEFGRLIGISQSAVQNYEKGNIPKGDVLIKIHKSLGVDITWLLTGEGEPPKQANKNPSEVGYILEKGTPKEIPIQTAQAEHQAQEEPFIRVPTALSRLKQEGDEFIFEESTEEAYAFKKGWVLRMTPHVDNLVLLHIRGDSMEPFICSGDVVMIDRGRKDITEGCIYAIAMEDVVYLKKLLVMPLGKVKVISENKNAYEPFEMNRKDLRILGEVVWFSRQLG